jgi:CheY-like chemotaxis protein
MKILIVEDHPGCRQLLAFFLRNMGHQLIEAENGEEAISRAATAQPDLIFMDLSLSDMNGVEVTATLKRNPQTSQIPIAIVSALPVNIWRTKTLKAGAAEYLTNPASVLELRQAIEKLTAIRHELRG